MEKNFRKILREELDCISQGTYPALQGDKKGMYPEKNTLPKQHTPSIQGGVVVYQGLTVKELAAHNTAMETAQMQYD